MGTIKVGPHRNSNALPHPLSLCQHLHRVCLLGLLHLKLDTEALKDSYLQVLILRNSKTSHHQVLPYPALHRRVLVHLLEALRQACLLDSTSQAMGEQDSGRTILKRFERTMPSSNNTKQPFVTQDFQMSDIWPTSLHIK